MHERLYKEFRQLLVLELVSDAELLSLSQNAERREIAQNRTFIREGDPSNSLFIILNGQVKVFRMNKQGREVIFGFFGQGSFLGEVALLTGQDRSASVAAVSDCALAEISLGAFDKHAERFSGLILLLAKDLAAKLAHSTEQLSDITFYEIPERLLKALILISTDQGEAQVIDARPTQSDLAAMIGTSREMISRALKELEGASKIKTDGRKILIPKATDSRKS